MYIEKHLQFISEQKNFMYNACINLKVQQVKECVKKRLREPCLSRGGWSWIKLYIWIKYLNYTPSSNKIQTMLMSDSLHYKQGTYLKNHCRKICKQSVKKGYSRHSKISFFCARHLRLALRWVLYTQQKLNLQKIH